jgi:hypothetical protein
MQTGCTARPRAPALQSGPVYQSKQEGIRFRVPDSWVQTARAEFPSGKLEKERLLVSYRARDRIAAFELNAIDHDESRDLGAYLAERAYGSKSWKPAGSPQSISISGISGTHYLMNGRIDKEPMTLDVVAIRRGDRVYLFKGIYATADKTAREQLHDAVHSVVIQNH